jgi:hypothetical protein
LPQKQSKKKKKLWVRCSSGRGACLVSMSEALDSIPSTAKKQINEKECQERNDFKEKLTMTKFVKIISATL